MQLYAYFLTKDQSKIFFHEENLETTIKITCKYERLFHNKTRSKEIMQIYSLKR